MHYIYTITNLLNYKVYVGQTTSIKSRWWSHKCEARSTRAKYPVHLAMKKYGIDNFQFCIVGYHHSQQEVDLAEIHWIEFFDSRNSGLGYNISIGGNVNSGWHHTEESKKKISEGNIGKEKPHTDEWKAQMSEILSGRVLTGEWKEKIAASNRGQKRSEETRRKISETQSGRRLSEETRKKISEAHKGKPKSEETRKRMATAQQKRSKEK